MGLHDSARNSHFDLPTRGQEGAKLHFPGVRSAAKPRDAAFLEANPVPVWGADGQQCERFAHPRLMADARNRMPLERREKIRLRGLSKAFGRDQRAVVDRREKLRGLCRTKPGAVVETIESKACAIEALHHGFEALAALFGQLALRVDEPGSPFFSDCVADEEEVHG